MQLAVAGHPPVEKPLPTLAERQTATLDIDADFPIPGDEAVRVSIPPDALPLDNVRYAVAEVVSAIRVLVVNGEPSADEFDDEVGFDVDGLERVSGRARRRKGGAGDNGSSRREEAHNS